MSMAGNKHKRAERGFTIMETMMVLAIAGLILIIVFRAIPSLQRSSRNNQRRQDVQTILGAVSHYELNDSGKFPDDCGGGGLTACTVAGGSTPNDYFLQFVANKLTFYTNSNQVLARHLSSASHATQAPNTALDTVLVYNYEQCDQTGGGSTFQGAGYSDVVALYAIETGSGAAPQCQQL